MLDPVQETALAAQHKTSTKQQYLSYRKNSRMAGSIAVWATKDTAKDVVSQKLALAENNAQTTQTTPETALAYSNGPYGSSTNAPEAFGFSDILDMINPLHHIPLVSTLYRNITGDEIKPISKIIGGSVFGGIAGAGSALVNIIIEEETGRDITSNIMHLASGESISFKNSYVPDHPEKRLDSAIEAVEHKAENELPGSVLSFVDLGGGKQRVYERYIFDDDERMAGSMIRIREGVLASQPPREPITQVRLSPWPTYND